MRYCHSIEEGNFVAVVDTVVKEMNLLKNLYKSIGISLPPEARDKLEKELKRFNK